MADNSAAVAAAKDRLAGRSSREVGREKSDRAMTWIHRWGWSWPGLIDYIGGGRRGLAARLTRSRLVDRHASPSGGADGTPAAILTATPDGVMAAEAHIDNPAPYPNQPEKHIPWRTLRHDAALQTLTAIGMQEPARLIEWGILGHQNDGGLLFICPEESIHDYISERELRHQLGSKQRDGETQRERTAASRAKVHDIIWTVDDGQKQRQMAVELELTHKKTQEFSAAVIGIAQQILDPESEIEDALIIAGTPAIYRRYQAIIDGAPIQPYERNRYRQWVKDGSARPLSDKARERMRAIRLPLRDIRLPGA